MSLNISEIKSNRAMKFGQLIEYNKRNTVLQKSCRKRGKLFLVQNLFLFFKKALCKVKEICLEVGSVYFNSI